MDAPGSSCLSVFGLAWDATEREVHVLFSGCPGYVRCIVVPGKTGGQKPYAFVQFGTPQEATAALESRQGTTWDQGLPAASIEFAKRNIPDNFVPRQNAGAEWSQPHHQQPVAPAPVAISPVLKRPRLEVVGRAPMQETIGKGGGSFNNSFAPVADAGPRTLHIGGLPPALQQEDLDLFLSTTFGPSCVGGKLNDSGGSGRACRAFVGFVSHKAASDALATLEGFTWEGSLLRAEWARSEFRPNAGCGGAGGGAPPPGVPAAGASAMRVPLGGGGAQIGAAPAGWAAAPPRAQAKGGGKGGAGGNGTWQPSRRTLHFTNLPAGISEREFEHFLSGNFPEQVVCAHFKETHDGRPPIAWVLFSDDETAASIASSHQNFDLGGTQVLVQFARTELDPSKFQGKGG